MCVCVCVCVCVCSDPCVCVCMCPDLCVCVCVCVCPDPCVCVCVCVLTRVEEGGDPVWMMLAVGKARLKQIGFGFKAVHRFRLLRVCLLTIVQLSGDGGAACSDLR